MVLGHLSTYSLELNEVDVNSIKWKYQSKAPKKLYSSLSSAYIQFSVSSAKKEKKKTLCLNTRD